MRRPLVRECKFQGIPMRNRRVRFSVDGSGDDSVDVGRSTTGGRKGAKLRSPEDRIRHIGEPDQNTQHHRERRGSNSSGCVQHLADGTIVFVFVSGRVVVHGNQSCHAQLRDQRQKRNEPDHGFHLVTYTQSHA